MCVVVGSGFCLNVPPPTQLDAYRHTLSLHGARPAAALRADLADERAVLPLVEQAAAAVGPLGLLVNNASVFEFDDLAGCDRASWDLHLDTNLRAPLVLIQRFAPAPPVGARGLVVNILDPRGWNLAPGPPRYTRQEDR